MEKDEYLEAVKNNASRLYSLALSYTKNVHDSEDIVQNVFIKLWRSDMIFNDDEHIDKWLSRVCVNECKSFLTSSFRKNVVLSDELIKGNIVHNENNLDLLSAIMKLKKKERIVIHFYYYEEYKISDIAEILSTNESTVKTRLRRARNRLKELLGDDYYDNV